MTDLDSIRHASHVDGYRAAATLLGVYELPLGYEVGDVPPLSPTSRLLDYYNSGQIEAILDYIRLWREKGHPDFEGCPFCLIEDLSQRVADLEDEGRVAGLRAEIADLRGRLAAERKRNHDMRNAVTVMLTARKLIGQATSTPELDEACRAYESGLDKLRDACAQDQEPPISADKRG